ncbi:hypothetical protein O181_041310 [Austropuccinia psidii MF-1]|uniref:Uncharacterized protein n=1 Tax=Austropuccinia psidii MF-1 TaxID=1389203 RepID=A0A9Q3HH11_9BASI|nr:hypothetical protein [Austropuccinia psidii MF-1]
MIMSKTNYNLECFVTKEKYLYNCGNGRKPKQSLDTNNYQKTGISWSQLNRLPYWDPVLCVSLGVMNNSYEGVLHHHFGFHWGFDTDLIQQTKMKSGRSGMEFKSMDLDDSETSNEESKVFAVECLSNDSKQTIRNKIKDVIVPKGVSQITSKVGTSGNGQLKESEWRVLFSVYIPLVFLDSLFETEPQNHLLLVNTTALIKCTEIVGAKSITQEEAALFPQDYGAYQTTSSQLFKNIKITPNHHYTMHMPEQLMRWGPLIGVSEFGGERLIGTLVKFKNN